MWKSAVHVLSGIAGVIVFGVAVETSSAQSGGVSYVTFDTVDRVFAPAATDQGVVLGLLSYSDPAATQGSNVKVLWHEMGADGSFDTWAWEDDDLGMAARWVRVAYSDITLFSQDTEISIAIAETDPGATTDDPIKFTFGLFETDPLQPALPATSDPGGLVDVLAGIGYAAAPTYSGIAAGAAAPGGTGGVGGGWVPTGCIAAHGSEEEVLLQDLYRRATLILAGIDPGQAANDPCGWPCVCDTSYGPWVAGPWVGGPSIPISGGGGTECHWERQYTRNRIRRGEFWGICFDCYRQDTQYGACDKAQDIIVGTGGCPAGPGPNAAYSYDLPCAGY